MSEAPIRLLLADDQAMVRGALAAMLDLEPDLTVVAQLGDGTGVARAVVEHEVDVALLDIEMPGLDGIEATRAVQEAAVAAGRTCRCLIVTTFGRPGSAAGSEGRGLRWAGPVPRARPPGGEIGVLVPYVRPPGGEIGVPTLR